MKCEQCHEIGYHRFVRNLDKMDRPHEVKVLCDYHAFMNKTQNEAMDLGVNMKRAGFANLVCLQEMMAHFDNEVEKYFNNQTKI